MKKNLNPGAQPFIPDFGTIPRKPSIESSSRLDLDRLFHSYSNYFPSSTKDLKSSPWSTDYSSQVKVGEALPIKCESGGDMQHFFNNNGDIAFKTSINDYEEKIFNFEESMKELSLSDGELTPTARSPICRRKRIHLPAPSQTI